MKRQIFLFTVLSSLFFVHFLFGQDSFEVTNSSEQTLLKVKDNGNVGIGVDDPVSAKLEVNGNIIASEPTADNHVATKAYVDALASNNPSQISNRSSSEMDFDVAIAYCRNLSESSYDDWYLPTVEEMNLFIDNPSDTNELWTRTPDYTSQTDKHTVRLSDGRLNTSHWSTDQYARCVRK